MDRPIRVGVIGASPARGWALRAHLPALRELPEYEITAVAGRAETLDAAARLFGAEHAVTDGRRLAELPDVDLVAVTVRVAEHAELVGAALAAGKHVYCEWPLTRTTAEAEALVTAAGGGGDQQSGPHHAVGLQGRFGPAVRYARELAAHGRLGRITSVTGRVARTKGAELEVPAWTAYTYQEDCGAGLLEVTGGHAIDLAEYLVGPVAELSARLAVQHPEHVVAETGERLAVTAPDHLALHATLAGPGQDVADVVAVLDVRDGAVGPGRAVVEICGTEGELVLAAADDDAGTADVLGTQVQISPPRLRLARDPGGWRELAVPERFRTVPDPVPDAALNVAELYRRLAGEIRTGERTVPDLAAGLRLHRILDAVRASAAGGRTVTPPAAPSPSAAS
jgi:predicted dehydrogenase